MKLKNIDEIRNLLEKEQLSLIGRSIWGQAKKEFQKLLIKKLKMKWLKIFLIIMEKYFC